MEYKLRWKMMKFEYLVFIFIFHLSAFHTFVLAEWTDIFLEQYQSDIDDIDECISNPCVNGGQCNHGNNHFWCNCSSGFTGDSCETDINECSSDPCQNGGKCIDESNQFRCSCVPGFKGKTCEIDIDECRSNPCQNGGQCTVGVDRLWCLCKSGFSGDNCEIDIDECRSNPCQNGGRCIDGVDHFRCLCKSGFSVDNCETDIDVCRSNPCQNGGRCINFHSSHLPLSSSQVGSIRVPVIMGAVVALALYFLFLVLVVNAWSKQNNEVTKWEAVMTVEDAMSVINEDKLPDKHTLCNLSKRLGRKSDTVSFVCERIVTKIEQTTPEISHVFAAYSIENQNNVHFVEYFDDDLKKYDSNKDYDIIVRNNKENAYESEQIRECMELSTEESLALTKTVNAISKQYMEKYKYLSAITARKIKSEEGENLCIIMYVHPCTGGYSSIPISEEPFPNEINGFEVVLCNGVFKAATKTAGEYHDDVRMGCKITSNLVAGHGTLGGFINHPIYGLCGFTCAHVLYDVKQMQDLKKAKRFKNAVSYYPCLVYQPSTDYKPIGRVVRAVYTEGDSDSSGVDLALFQIENRPPRSGTFPSSSQDEKLEYITGETWGRTRLTSEACEITKFGVTTGITNGKLLFDGMSVRSLSFVTKAPPEGVDSVLYNQYEIMNDTCNVCDAGDSGGLVFMKDCTNELVCIGMVNGVLDKVKPTKHGVVTPITDILLELNVRKFKTFNKELIVDRLEKLIAETAVATQNQVRMDLSAMRGEIISEINNIMANFRR